MALSKIPKSKKTRKPKISYFLHPEGFHTLKEFKEWLAEKAGKTVDQLPNHLHIYPAVYRGKEYGRLSELEKAMSKYGSVGVVWEGRRYKSQKEVAFAKKLSLLMHAKDPAEKVIKIQNEVPFKMEINGIEICKYMLDFRVTYADGRVVHYDTKGFVTDVYRMKKRLMLAIHGIHIIEP